MKITDEMVAKARKALLDDGYNIGNASVLEALQDAFAASPAAGMLAALRGIEIAIARDGNSDAAFKMAWDAINRAEGRTEATDA